MSDDMADLEAELPEWATIERSIGSDGTRYISVCRRDRDIAVDMIDKDISPQRIAQAVETLVRHEKRFMNV